MVEVRKSTRIKTEPSSAKRRFSVALEAEATPAKPVKAAKTAKNATPKTAPKHQPVQESDKKLVLPSKITDSTPLPVLPSPQPNDLDDAQWQDLSVSAVFATSLVRTRQAIARGAFFHKFWTKPVVTKKLKDMTEEEKAAAKAAKGPTHSKVGMLKMISEPLTFEVQILMIKDQLNGHRQGQLPLDKMHLIYGQPQKTASPAYHQNYRPTNPPPPARPHAHIQVAPNRPSMVVTPNRPAVHTASHPPSNTHTQQPPPSNQTATRPPSTPAPSIPANKPAANPQAPDPVIHALAQRASSNADLKAVMKIVATGKATPQQLAYFQRHIDELTELVRQRQEHDAKTKAAQQIKSEVKTEVKREASSMATTISTPPQARPPVTPGMAPNIPASQSQSTPTSAAAPRQPLVRPPISNPSPVVAPPPLHHPPPSQSQPHSQPHTPAAVAQHPQYRAPPPVPQLQAQQPWQKPAPAAHPIHQQHYQVSTPVPVTPRPKIITTATPLHILLQFAENPNERFEFPKDCVLEWNSTLTEVICSFVCTKKVKVQKGTSEDGTDEKEVWLPVTVTFQGDAPTLSVLGRVAEPVQLAKERMEDEIVRCERGEDAYLALRLPNEPTAVET